MNDPFVIVVRLVFLAIAVGGVIWILVAIQRHSEAGEKSIRVGVLVAFGTALLVFVITYCAAWAELRQEMARRLRSRFRMDSAEHRFSKNPARNF